MPNPSSRGRAGGLADGTQGALKAILLKGRLFVRFMNDTMDETFSLPTPVVVSGHVDHQSKKYRIVLLLQWQPQRQKKLQGRQTRLEQVGETSHSGREVGRSVGLNERRGGTGGRLSCLVLRQ